ncbi:MAG TPA: MFS transporter, partial [Chloroflexota bacterium]|nr:MFS transporter [Chloroflexota bacterium]
GWRWIFWLNLPVCVLAMLVGWRAIPSVGRLAGLRPALLGEAVITAAAALGLMLALNTAAESGWAAPALLLLLLAAAAVVVWLRLPTATPVVEALRRRALAGQLAALVLGAIVAGAVYFLVPFLLQGVLGQSAAEAGMVLLAMPLAMALTSQVGGQAADRFGARPAAAAGTLLIVAAGLLLLPLDPSWSGLDVAWRLALIGLGSGFFAGPNQSGILAATPPSLVGTVGALSSLGRALGFALGPALATILWTGRQFSAEAMRPAFLMVAILAVFGVVAVLATPRRAAPAPGAPR